MTHDEERDFISKALLAGECGCAAVLIVIAGLVGWLAKGG